VFFHNNGAAILLLLCVGVPAVAFVAYLAIDGIRNILLRRRHQRDRGLID